MYSELSTLLEYKYFYISKNITLYTFLLVFKIIESLKYHYGFWRFYKQQESLWSNSF